MDDASQLDTAIRALLRTLSISEENAPKLPNGDRLGLLDMELLALIGEQPGLQAKALIKLLGVKPTTLQSAVNRLVGRGIVERDTKALKGRSVALRLTSSGVSVSEHIRAHNLRNCAALLESLAVNERAAFVRSMTKLADTLAASKKAL